VVLGPDGLPESIRVDPGWRRAVGSEGIADAVVEACAAAANAQFAARVEEAGSAPATASGAPPPAAMSGAVPPSASDGPIRDLGEMARELVAIMSSDEPLIGEARGTGTTAFGKLEITLSEAGLQSFTADPGWVSRQTDEDLMDALVSALSSARADLSATANHGRENDNG
jgi:hypothetical protein